MASIPRDRSYMREIRPITPRSFEVRFETPPGCQAQVDFAHFRTERTDEPGVERVVWLFIVGAGPQPHAVGAVRAAAGYADSAALPRRGVRGFGGEPAGILYVRMKTVVTARHPRTVPTPVRTSSAMRTLLQFCAFHYEIRAKSLQVLLGPSMIGQGGTTRSSLYPRRISSSAEPSATATTSTASGSPMARPGRRCARLTPPLSPGHQGTFRRGTALALNRCRSGHSQTVLRLERRITTDGMVVRSMAISTACPSPRVADRSRCICSANEVRILEEGKIVALQALGGRPRPASDHRRPSHQPGAAEQPDTASRLAPWPRRRCRVAPAARVLRRPLQTPGRRRSGGMISSTMPENPVERIRHNLVGLRKPRAYGSARGRHPAASSAASSEQSRHPTFCSPRRSPCAEGRRIKTALQMARLATIKTLTGFDFSFQPSLDRSRIMALSQPGLLRQARGRPLHRSVRHWKKSSRRSARGGSDPSWAQRLFLPAGRYHR